MLYIVAYLVGAVLTVALLNIWIGYDRVRWYESVDYTGSGSISIFAGVVWPVLAIMGMALLWAWSLQKVGEWIADQRYQSRDVRIPPGD